jgi:hypothetical protein
MSRPSVDRGGPVCLPLQARARPRRPSRSRLAIGLGASRLSLSTFGLRLFALGALIFTLLGDALLRLLLLFALRLSLGLTTRVLSMLDLRPLLAHRLLVLLRFRSAFAVVPHESSPPSPNSDVMRATRSRFSCTLSSSII